MDGGIGGWRDGGTPVGPKSNGVIAMEPKLAANHRNALTCRSGNYAPSKRVTRTRKQSTIRQTKPVAAIHASTAGTIFKAATAYAQTRLFRK